MQMAHPEPRMGTGKTSIAQPARPVSPATTSKSKSYTCTTFLCRVINVTLILGLYLVFRKMTRAPTTEVDLSQYTSSIFVPFVYKFSTKSVPEVMCVIEGVEKPRAIPIDTGSGIFLLGAPLLTNIGSTAGTPAHHFFTSSKILYVGRLNKLSVTFQGEGGMHATANVPILVVDKSWRCPWYDPSSDAFECPVGPNGEKPQERNTSRITYMGVGFGRNNPRDGMPFATPSLNPFLNIDTVNGLPVAKESMRSGYIISSRGVRLGLTRENTKGFSWTSLQPGIGHGSDSRDWAMARMCFSINGEGNNCGPVLIDSGIPQMYVRAEEGVSIPTIVIRNPNKNGHAKFVKRVKPGTKVSVGFPSLDAPAMSYSFIIGQNSSTEPSYVVPAKPASAPFVNTGRNFFFGYSIVFDAIGGRFGYSPVDPPSSSLL